MLEWSVGALRAVPAVERIVIALPASELDSAPLGTTAVAGGEFRSQSVRAALHACGAGDPVIVHDAARPLAPPQLFTRALAQLERSRADGVIAAIPVSDTIKQVDAPGGTVVSRTLERGLLWAVQTPQVFRRAALDEALAQASEESLAAATDDAWLVERLGGVVRVVESSADNLKITTSTDLRVAELLLAERGARA